MIIKTIVLLVDDSRHTERVFPHLVQRLTELISTVYDVNINLVYLYSDESKPILDLSLGCRVSTCFCLKIKQNRTDFQELSRRIYELFKGKQLEAIFSSSSPVCKECMAALAFLFKTGLAADCSALTIDSYDSKFCFERIVGDYPPKSAIVKIMDSSPQMATFVDVVINSNSFDIVSIGKSSTIVEVPHNCFKLYNGEYTDYLANVVFQKYKVYFVIGAGVDSYEIAEKLRLFANNNGIGFGITRQILNRGWYDSSLLIGISGKKIAPNVCVALGVSGAYQSYVGIKDSIYIISVNNDSSAPIVNYAHKTIVSDVNKVIRELIISER